MVAKAWLGLCLILLPLNAHAEVIDLEGTVKSIDAEARSISVARKTPKGEKTLELEVAKKAGDLSGVNEGDSVSFSYDPDLELITKIGKKGGSDPVRAPKTSRLGPGPNDKEICVAVCNLLETEHYLQQELDDDICSKWFDVLARSIDPQKLFLTAGDIDGFSKKKGEFRDQLKRGDLSTAYELFNRFLERVDSRLPTIEALVNGPQDFSKKESLEIDLNGLQWTKTETDAKDAWRKRIKYELLSQKMEKVPSEEAKTSLLDRYKRSAQRMHNMTSEDFTELCMTALAHCYDADSMYMSAETVKSFEAGIKMQLHGIGASIQKKDDDIVIGDIVPSGAAARDGRLRKGDRLVGIGQGDSGKIEDVRGMAINDVVDRIRGQKGTVVRLRNVPVGRSASVVYPLTRAQINLRDSEARGEVFEVGKKPDGSAFKVGMIRVPAFYMDMAEARKGSKDYSCTSRECRKLLEGFRLQNVDCVVVDVRNNMGGSLPEAIAVAGLFIDKGRVVQIQTAGGDVEKYDDKEAGRAWAGPLLVLVNTVTAANAEVFVGAMQDHRRGIVVGDKRTHGQTSTHKTVPIDKTRSLGMMKYWSGCFYGPSGEAIQQRGIESDIPLPSMNSDIMDDAEEMADGTTKPDRLPKAGFKPTGQVTVGTIKKLKDQSAVRVEKSKRFQAIVEQADRGQKERRRPVPLEEKEFEKRWQADNPDTEADAMNKQSKNAFARNFYLDEVLNIARDLASVDSDK